MGIDTGSTIDPKSIIITPSISSIVDAISKPISSPSLPTIDEELMRIMENDPSGGVILDRMDRATAEALAIERLRKEGKSSPLFNHLSLPQPTEVRVVASKRDAL